MCGRFSIEYSWQEMHEAYSLLRGVPVLPDKESKARLDIRPTNTVDVLRNGAEGFEWAEMQWGLKPAWAKSILINARADKMTGRFWGGMAPAVIFVSGFYEWPKKAGGKKPPNYARYNFTITSQPVMMLAALCQDDCFVVCTTTPNPMFEKLPHHRMAAILTPESFEPWMDSEPNEREAILEPYPSQLMTGQAVEISEMFGTEELRPIGEPL